MSIESRLTELEEAQRLLRDAKWLQGRRMSAAAPNDNELVGFNAEKGIWEPKSPSLQLARCTSNLTLTTSAQSIVGDGNSTKVRLLLPSIGKWLIIGTFDFSVTASDPGTCQGELFFNDSGSAEAGGARFATDDTERATVGQSWVVTATAANQAVELKAKKSGAGGTALAIVNDTTLMAIGIAGGTAAVGAHGDLTGVTSDQHHAQDHQDEHLWDGGDALAGVVKISGTIQSAFTVHSGSGKPKIALWGQPAGTGDYSVIILPPISMSGARLITLPDDDGTVALTSDLYTDSDAITAVPFLQYIPFGSEPITGQSYAP